MTVDWSLRHVDDALAGEWIRNGWWTDDTLGSLLDRGLAVGRRPAVHRALAR